MVLGLGTGMASFVVMGTFLELGLGSVLGLWLGSVLGLGGRIVKLLNLLGIDEILIVFGMFADRVNRTIVILTPTIVFVNVNIFKILYIVRLFLLGGCGSCLIFLRIVIDVIIFLRA